ncbi:hypothetical protein ACFL3V_02890 [Nanoarchaeota archaeon]
MDLSTVVAVVVVIVLGIFLMKMLGKVMSFAFSVAGIVVVVWLVIAGLRYLDEQSVRDKILDSNNLFLLEEDGNLLTGFVTQEGMPDPDIEAAAGEFDNPNSGLYDDYYKVIVVKKEALPEKTSLMVDVASDPDKADLFRNYVDENLLEGDAVENLVEEEQQGNIEVHKESMAFRKGIKDVLFS